MYKHHSTINPIKKTTKYLVVGIILASTAIIALLPLGVHAVQNIFTSFEQITDIQFAGQNIDQIVYQGEIIWERTHN